MKCKDCGNRKIKSRTAASFSKRRLVDQWCKKCLSRNVEGDK